MIKAQRDQLVRRPDPGCPRTLKPPSISGRCPGNPLHLAWAAREAGAAGNVASVLRIVTLRREHGVGVPLTGDRDFVLAGCFGVERRADPGGQESLGVQVRFSAGFAPQAVSSASPGAVRSSAEALREDAMTFRDLSFL